MTGPELEVSIQTDDGEWVPVQGVMGFTFEPAPGTAAEQLEMLGKAWTMSIVAAFAPDDEAKLRSRRRPGVPGKFPTNPQGFARRGKRR